MPTPEQYPLIPSSYHHHHTIHHHPSLSSSIIKHRYPSIHHKERGRGETIMRNKESVGRGLSVWYNWLASVVVVIVVVMVTIMIMMMLLLLLFLLHLFLLIFLLLLTCAYHIEPFTLGQLDRCQTHTYYYYCIHTDIYINNLGKYDDGAIIIYIITNLGKW